MRIYKIESSKISLGEQGGLVEDCRRSCDGGSVVVQWCSEGGSVMVRRCHGWLGGGSTLAWGVGRRWFESGLTMV